MPNDNLTADEILLCERIVMETQTILEKGESRDDFVIGNQDDHYTTLRYGGIMIYVYSHGRSVDIQGNGSEIKSYDDGKCLMNLLYGTDGERLDVHRDAGAYNWIEKVTIALPDRPSDTQPNC